MPKRFVYVLRCLRVPERRYVGLTADVEARLNAHNAGLSPFTARYRPWTVTVCIAFADERNASRFEKYLKGPSGRAFARRHFDMGEASTPVDIGQHRQRPARASSKRHL